MAELRQGVQRTSAAVVRADRGFGDRGQHGARAAASPSRDKWHLFVVGGLLCRVVVVFLLFYIRLSQVKRSVPLPETHGTSTPGGHLLVLYLSEHTRRCEIISFRLFSRSFLISCSSSRASARRAGSGSKQRTTKALSSGDHADSSRGGAWPCAASHIAMNSFVRPCASASAHGSRPLASQGLHHVLETDPNIPHKA